MQEEEEVFCAGCNQRLLEPGLQADQGRFSYWLLVVHILIYRFHSSCLSCHECAQPLSRDFWLVDGHRYCQLHRLAALPRWTCWCCDWMLNQSIDDHSMLERIQATSINVVVIIICPPLHCQVFKLRRDCKSWRGCGRGAWQDLKKEV